jgi:hypothetical protein
MNDTHPQTHDEQDATRANVRAAVIVFLTAGAVFALFGSGEMVSMSYDLPENAWTAPLVAAAERWHGAMEMLGTAGFSQSVRDAVADLRAIWWS